MKIFFPLEVFYPSQAGGPANSIYWLTKNLTREGFAPIIVATDKGLGSGVPLNRWLESDAGKVIYVKTRFLNFPLYQTLVALQSFFRADVVQLSSIFFPTAFVTAFAARFLGKKMIWSARGELDPPALNHSRLRKMPILWCIRHLIGVYPVFHSTCAEETLYIKQNFGAGARVAEIPNFIEIPSKVERKPSKYLLYIGRIHPKKAIDNLLRALTLSKDFLRSDFVLKIAGSGKQEFEEDLQRLIRELRLSSRVQFLGQVEGEEKQHLLADAYFTIMPSHSENFGLVVLESLAQNTPVIASKGTPWAVLEEEKIGFWLDNSPEQLAGKIDEILTMPAAEYENLRGRARAFVEREFDIRRNLDRWLALYRDLRNP